MSSGIRVAPTPATPRERLEVTATSFVKNSLALIPIFIALRAYEVFIASQSHPLPDGTMLLLLRGFRSDLGLICWSAAVFAIPVLLIGLASPRVARKVHRGLLFALIILGILLAQYFSVTLVPLGSDLYGYSLRDIKETAGASKGVGVMTFVPILVFGLILLFTARYFERRKINTNVVLGFFGVVVVASAFNKLFALGRGAYSSDAAYYFADNKTVYFTGRSIDYFGGQRAQTNVASNSGLSGYPLLHDAAYDDVLGPFMNVGVKRPNLVFVVVEGLGRDFVGAGARYGGFTPFIDSLTTQSLYWENFLSTSGRTFSVLPSLFASAPFGQSGFMELGSRMPRHISLISLLKDAGYKTEYFTGTAGHFDNIDLFMNREGVDKFIDQSKFPESYDKQPAVDGFSWGYGDMDLVKRSFEVIGPPTDSPRLDIYLTITTHEPFIPPRTAEYDARFAQRLSSLPVDAGRKSDYQQNEIVFRTLLYLDDAIRLLINTYRQRSDFDRTIFFITGDHRLIPLPEQTRLDRYHVPFIVYSPMLKAPHKFSSVSTHLDVTPTVLSLLDRSYHMTFPEKVSWLGTGMDTAAAFRNIHSSAFMRTKNTLEDYLDGDKLLSGDDMFQLRAGFALSPFSDTKTRGVIREKLDRFKQINTFVTSGDHLYPGGTADTTDAKTLASEDSLWKTLKADTTPEKAFKAAQQRAFSGDYPGARLLTRRLLRESPNDYDSRVLLGRTYAWDKQYDTAIGIFRDVLRRAGDYSDASAALADVEIWSGHYDVALAVADSGLKTAPKSGDLWFGRAKALEQLNRKKEAIAAMDSVDKYKPNFPDAVPVRKRLTAK